MKKLLLLFCALLCLGGSRAWAADGYITVKIADGTNTNGPASYGDANSGGVSSVVFKSTWTSNAASGKAGLTLSAKTSADIASNALAEETSYSSYHCLGFKPSAGNATDVLTITAPSGYIITGYYIEAGYWTSKQNYTLTAGAGSGTTTYTTIDAPKNGTPGLDVSSINASSTTISIKSNQEANDRCLMINKFTVTIFPKELYDAKASITSGRLYRIFTKNNGTAEGDTKYYLTTSGTLTTETASAGQFIFNATTTNCYVPAGYAWMISNGNNRFTNRPYQSPGQTHLNTTSGNNRDTYEAQVFYLNEGKYAVRSTNFDGSGSDYVQNSYWTVVADITDDGVPDATYDDTEGTKHYVWQLEEIASVTYNLIYEGNTIATMGPLDNSSGTYNGTAALPTDTWSNPYCSYSYSPTTITSETRTVNITMTWSGPFTISSDYASATWGYLKLRGKYAKYDKDLTITSDVAYPLYSNKSDVRYTDEGLWAFVGNPIQGVRLFNKAAGSGKCIQWTTQPQMDLTSKGNAVYWKIGKLDGYGFLLNYGGFYLHDLGGNTPGKLGIWNGGGASTDPGSAFVVEDLDWRDKAIFAVQDFAKSYTTGVYFGTDETLYNSTINSIKTYPSFTEEMYNGTITSLNNGELLKYPATGYYLIKHVSSNYYLGTDGSIPVLQSSIAASNIARLEKGSGNSYNISVQGAYIRPQARGYMVLIGKEPSYALSGKLVENTDYSELWVGDSYCIYASTSDYSGQPLGWDSYGTATQWTIEDADGASFTVPLTNVGDYSYATLYLPFGATITGAKAYILTVSGEWAIPHEISEVPANTGVLLRAEGDVDEVTVTVKSAATADTEGNMLAGTNIEITTERSDGEYILGNGEDGLGFYQRKSGRKIGANKAYLQLDADLAVKGLLLNFDIATGIDGLTPDTSLSKKGEEIFNLAGQRMSRVQKGVNIVNGKKVLVK